MERNKPSQTDTKDPKHKKYAQTTHRNLINLGEDTRTPTINTPRQQYERQPTHTIGSPHPNRKIYSVGILESRSTKNYFIINMYEDTSPYLEKTRKNDQATTRMRTRIKDHISKEQRLQMRLIERILGGGGRKSRRTQTLEEGSYINDMESCNILTLRHRNGRISEVASRTETPIPKKFRLASILNAHDSTACCGVADLQNSGGRPSRRSAAQPTPFN